MKKRLRIIPVPDPRLIPRYLVDQVKDRDWEVDDWYQLQVKSIGEKTNVVLSFIDDHHLIKGFLWLTIDNFCKHIFINTISIDQQFQEKEKLINYVHRYIKEMTLKLGLKRVMWGAVRTKALEKYGYQPSKYQLMEYNIEVEDGKQVNKAKRSIDLNERSK